MGMPMSDNEIQLAREVSELKAEVRRLRRLIEGAFIVLGVAAIVLYPGILVLVASFCILCLFAFLVSPVRRLIFSSWFSGRGGRDF